jgi:cytochrome oxidase Cu insertion factor (SCO1/SenC/PrrC family)
VIAFAAPAIAAAPGGARFEPPAPGSYELPPIARVDDRPLLASDGTEAPLLGLARGEAALVSFVYLHCPDACPLGTATLQQVDRSVAERPELAARVHLVTVSFDPARDTPERMSALRRSLAPRGRWSFLTAASAASLEPVLADFGQDVVRADGRVESHVMKVFLVDGQRRIRNVYSAGFLDPRILVNDLLTVLAE